MGMYRNIDSPPINLAVPQTPNDYGPNGPWDLDPNDLHGQSVADKWNFWMDNYQRDYESGKLDPFMWSIYAREFDSDEINPREKYTDQGSVVSGPIPPQYMDLKNDSVATESLLSINGLDEDLDGSHGWQDSEIAERLTQHCGIQWYGQPENLIYKPAIHFILNARRVERISKTNETIFYSKRNAGYPPVNNWDLRQFRQSIRSGM